MPRNVSFIGGNMKIVVTFIGGRITHENIACGMWLKLVIVIRA
jgi:hypothetical protein